MSNVSTDERETKKRERRRVNLTQSVISEGSPAFFGLEEEVRLTGAPNQFRTSTRDWLKLVEMCAENVGSWYNRKFYYETPAVTPKTNTYTSVASIIKNNGVTKNNDQHIQRLATRVKELSDVYRLNFETAYTRDHVPSDDPSKGECMHVIFVRAVPKSGEAKANLGDVLATSNAVDDRRFTAKEHPEPQKLGYPELDRRPVRDNPQA